LFCLYIIVVSVGNIVLSFSTLCLKKSWKILKSNQKQQIEEEHTCNAATK